MSKKTNGVILYQGASMIDGKPIVVIATGLNDASTNRKTGGMIQTHILRADVSPVDAVKTGADASICGDCKHRGNGDGKGRTCYVNYGQAQQSVYRGYLRGIYPVASAADYKRMSGRLIRFGSYGDPAAAPVQIWRELKAIAAGTTGYTHQWRSNPAGFAELVMASADTPAEALDAHALGFRTFRVAMPSDPAKLAGESRCPASAEAGKKLQCDTCLACHGLKRANGRTTRGSIVIQAHGGSAVMANVNRTQSF